MASYKIPQNVEAEDKLLGPLSFRQFIYALVGAGGIGMGIFLWQLSPFLSVIPLPLVIICAALALPLRKDQPMETYLLAVLRYYLKSKRRIWNPDGTITYVEITAPQAVEEHLTKELAGKTAEERLDYLSRVMDTHGWATKGVAAPLAVNANIAPTVAAESQEIADIMDLDQPWSQSFDKLIDREKQHIRQGAIDAMHSSAVSAPAAQPATTPAPAQTSPTAPVHYNPYPEAIHQKVVQPVPVPTPAQTPAEHIPEQPAATAPQVPQTQPTTSPIVTPPATDIIEDVSNNPPAPLRAQEQPPQGEEVIVNLH